MILKGMNCMDGIYENNYLFVNFRYFVHPIDVLPQVMLLEPLFLIEKYPYLYDHKRSLVKIINRSSIEQTTNAVSSVGQLIHHIGPGLKMLTNIEWIDIKFYTDIRGPYGMNPKDFGNLPSFPVVPPRGQQFWFHVRWLNSCSIVEWNVVLLHMFRLPRG